MEDAQPDGAFLRIISRALWFVTGACGAAMIIAAVVGSPSTADTSAIAAESRPLTEQSGLATN